MFNLLQGSAKWAGEPEEEEERYYGRGSRQRKEVDYSDSLTEKEWLKAIEEGEEEEEEETPKSRKKLRKRKKKDDLEASTSGESSHHKKRRGRPPGDKFDIPVDSKLKKYMKKLISTVVKYVDRDGRMISEVFMKLPSRKELPHYYEVIKRPIDIKKILLKLEDNKYGSFDDLERDFIQMCKNAQKYNKEGSSIHEDSIVLERVFLDARARLEKDTAEAAAAAVVAAVAPPVAPVADDEPEIIEDDDDFYIEENSEYATVP
ncbi:hypothetical protein R5R35_002543 [Gryllus longicercus]|uniref:Bromo domain-containing protein n=1 Tax=Gryllus longicercus TaxID=2509291 RepID=A0AAN9VVA7_9ORTH